MPKARYHYVEDYTTYVHHLLRTLPIDQAMAQAIGGNYAAVGEIEKQLLIQAGLRPDHTIVDIGCGSGRLARALVPYLTRGKYFGTDVVMELLQYAARYCPPHWRFTLVDKIGMPYEDASADFACFFSVFTHLLHEESYVYLREARRVVRPDGRIVFSFLELPYNVEIFDGNVKNVEAGMPGVHLNVFLGRDMIAWWAERLGLRIVEFRAATEPFIALEHPVVYDDGRRVEGLAALGQSVCILEVDDGRSQ
jgi:SAM-dependent methyltransferase